MTKYFAKLDSNSQVEAVHLVKDSIATSEQAGITYLNKLHNHSSWKECSKHNSDIRKNAAVIGMTYDADKNAFISPQPYSSWTLNDDTCIWEPPVERPAGLGYIWNEDTTSWDSIT